MLRRGTLGQTRWKHECRRYLATASHQATVAPGGKANYDLKAIRSNPDVFTKSCVARRWDTLADFPRQIIALHEQWVALNTALAPKQKLLKIYGDQLASLNRNKRSVVGEETRQRTLQDNARRDSDEIKKLQIEAARLLNQIQSLASQLPNLVSRHTPQDDKPKVLKYLNPDGKPKDHLTKRDHVKIAADFRLIDFAAAATTSGWGWYFLKNEADALEDALVRYAKKRATTHGFSRMGPPSMTYSHIASGCGYRPRDQNGEQQTYSIQQTEEDSANGVPQHMLTATAEIPLAGMMANRTFNQKQLPCRFVGASRCYRAEAGARGARTKGLYRVHEFTKVEMFGWTMPGEEQEVMDRMMGVQKEILESLGLHCRVLEMPATDLGASAARKQDIEVYFPSRDLAGIDEGWGEVTSTSICNDYQSRRLDTRVQRKTSLDYVSTVNGTALAVPRVLAALLEYGWQQDGTIAIPRVLHPYMDGVTKIVRQPDR